MKTINKLIIAGLIILLVSACSDKFLSVVPQDVLTNANFPSNEADAKAALNGVYNVCQSQYTFGGQVIPACLEWDMTGDLYEQDQNQPRVDLAMLNLPADNTYTTGMYQTLYQGIGQANFVIDAVGAMKAIDPTAQSVIIGQAKFLRALYYYTLVNYFGGVSLVLKELDATSNLDVPRSSKDSCWAQIEGDLKDAASVLPPTWSGADAGRATQGAALALLVKTYLWQQKWDSAVSVSEQIINSKVYGLLPKFRDVFEADNGNNKEIVFSTQFSAAQNGIEGMNEDVRTAPRGSSSEYVGRDAWSNFVPEKEWVNAFEKDVQGKIIDQRYWGVIIGPGEAHQEIPGFVMPTDVPNQGTKTGYIITKWWQAASATNVGVDFPVIRYAEVLLNYAEALNEVGRSQDAMKAVNEVRERAGLADKSLNLSKADVLSAIFYEARMGFIYEFYGAFSMLNRRGMFKDFIKTHRADFSQIDYDGKSWLQQSPILLPIPIAAWNVNKALVQNPGYPAFK